MAIDNKSLISLVIPVYNEAGNLVWHHNIINKFFDTKDYDKEIIYVDDGSRDNSFEIIKTIAVEDKSVRFISLSRNFGKEAATTAGLRKATGDAVIMIDADGQHPIGTVAEFINKWQEGFQQVIGVRQSNTNEGIIKRYGSKLFYKILNMLTDGNTVSGSTDFRLLDRKVVDEYNRLTEHDRITRGLIDWMGFKKAYVNFNSPARHSGKATYSYKKLVTLALHAFVSNSTKPLQLTGVLGVWVMVLSALTAVFLNS